MSSPPSPHEDIHLEDVSDDGDATMIDEGLTPITKNGSSYSVDNNRSADVTSPTKIKIELPDSITLASTDQAVPPPVPSGPLSAERALDATVTPTTAKFTNQASFPPELSPTTPAFTSAFRRTRRPPPLTEHDDDELSASKEQHPDSPHKPTSSGQPEEGEMRAVSINTPPPFMRRHVRTSTMQPGDEHEEEHDIHVETVENTQIGGGGDPEFIGVGGPLAVSYNESNVDEGDEEVRETFRQGASGINSTNGSFALPRSPDGKGSGSGSQLRGSVSPGGSQPNLSFGQMISSNSQLFAVPGAGSGSALPRTFSSNDYTTTSPNNNRMHPLYPPSSRSNSPSGLPAPPQAGSAVYKQSRCSSPGSGSVSSGQSSAQYYVHKTIVREDPNIKRFETEEITIHKDDVVMFEWTSVHNILQIDSISAYVEPIPCPEYVPNGSAIVSPISPSPMPSPMNQLESNNSFSGQFSSGIFVSNESFGNYMADGKRRSGDPSPYGRFTCSFDKVGTYYFCSETTPDMRVTIKVLPLPSSESFMILLMRTVLVMLIGGGALSAIVAVSVMTLEEDERFQALGGDDPALQELRDAFVAESFPWFLGGALIIVGVLLGGMAVQFRRTKLADYGRGFDAFAHSFTALVSLVVLTALLGTSFSMWYLTLRASDGWGKLATTLSDSIIMSINDIIKTIHDVQFLDRELPVLFEGYETPIGTKSANDTVTDILEISDTVKYYSAIGEDTLRAVIRLVSVFHFVSVQGVLSAVALGIVSTLQRKAHLAKAASWIAWLAAAFLCLSIGTTALLYHVVKITHDRADHFSNQDISLSELIGEEKHRSALEKNSTLVRALSLCTTDKDTISFDFIESALGEGIDALNAQLNASDIGVQIADGLNRPHGFEKLSIPELVNYSDHISSQLDALESIITTQNNFSSQLNSSIAEFNSNVSAIPGLRAVISVQKSLIRVIDCTLLREVIASAIPVMEEDILQVTHLQHRLMRATFSLSVLIAVGAGAAATVFARPRKIYTEPKTKRWFIFPYSLKIHQRILRRRKKKGKRPHTIWSPPICTVHFFVSKFHDSNTINAVLIIMQAALLVIVHYRVVTNYEGDSERSSDFDPHLLSALAMCLLLPVFTIPMAIAKQGAKTHIFLRILTIILALAILNTMATYSAENIDEAGACIRSAKKEQEDMKTTKTIEEVRADECNANEVAFRYEMAIYVLFVGVTSLVSFVTGMILLCFRRRVVSQPVYIPGASTAKLIFRKAIRFFSTPQGGVALAGCCLSIVSLLVVTALLIIFLAKDPEKQCNGRADNCKRRLNEMAWGCTHNSMSSSADRFIAANHYFGIKYQLEHGVRSLMLDVWEHEGEAYLCHKYCDLGKVSLQNALHDVYEFLRHNPREVIIIIFEQYVPHALITDAMENLQEVWQENATNAVNHRDGQNVTLWSDDPLDWVWYSEVRGTSPSTPNSNTSFKWPRVEDLIAANKRLLFFTDRGSFNFADRQAPWLMYMWDYFYETHFTVETPSDFTCNLHRGVTGDDATLRRKMSIMNHFLTLGGPVPSMASQVNSEAFVLHRGKQCAEEWNANVGSSVSSPRLPNFMPADFWSIGGIQAGMDAVNSYYSDRWGV